MIIFVLGKDSTPGSARIRPSMAKLQTTLRELQSHGVQIFLNEIPVNDFNGIFQKIQSLQQCDPTTLKIYRRNPRVNKSVPLFNEGSVTERERQRDLRKDSHLKHGLDTSARMGYAILGGREANSNQIVYTISAKPDYSSTSLSAFVELKTHENQLEEV